MFHLFQTYVTFKCFMLRVFHVSEVCSESHRGTAWGRSRQMGNAAHLGSCRRGVLVLIPAPCPAHAEREEGSGGRSGGRGAGPDGWERGTRAWQDEADREGLQRYGGSMTGF